MKIPFTLFAILFMSLSLAQNRFSNDAQLRQIYNIAYERKSDSLMLFLNHVNPNYSYAAIQGIYSVQDTSIAQNILQMLAEEKTDSIKLALIYAMSQLDCDLAFTGLKDYYQTCKNDQLKSACLEAIGKVSKTDVTDLFIQGFSAQIKPQAAFLTPWLKGLYLAKRRKHIALEKDNEQLIKQLNIILESKSAPADLVNYYYQKIMNAASAETAETIKTKVNSLNEIDNELKLIKTPYLQIASLAKYELSAGACQEFLKSDYNPLIKNYCLEVYLNKHSWNNKIDKPFIEFILDQMDVSLTSSICAYIVEQNKNKKAIDITVDVLQNTQRQLFLPRDFETWIDLEKAMLSFEGKTYQYKSCFETGYENPLDWSYIAKIDQNEKVKITTNKGSMVLMLKVNEAPGSVANFLKLVDAGFYNGKYFHRMVPNFVVQGGCPRGDGWGSLDWNQRSELSSNLRYKLGSVGLASVGKDSEGVQFFISHNFAPHLDGRYTIFAEVIKGFDVIPNLVVGDQMLSIVRIP